MALAEQQGADGRLCVQLAAIWRRYLPLCIYIVCFIFIFVLLLSIDDFQK